MSASAVLPFNSSDLERALADVLVSTRGEVPPVDTVVDPMTCPESLLGYMAWALSVDDWDALGPVAWKRERLAEAIKIHRHKGTVWSVLRSLAVAGFGDAHIQEFNGAQYDGSLSYDGSELYQGNDHWAEYRVIMARPITNEQAAKVRAILRSVAPARSHLKLLSFDEVANVYDGATAFDGAYNYGEA